MRNIIHICYFASNYPGNFIACLSKLTLASSQDHEIYFLFPEKARGQEWLSMLLVPEDHLFFCEFSPEGLRARCKELTKILAPKETISHTHFLDFMHLRAVKSVFKHNVCHYHMAAPLADTPKRKLRKLISNAIYRGSVIIGVSEPVTKGLRSYFPSRVCECITNAVDFDRLDTYVGGASTVVEKGPYEYVLLIHGSDFMRKGVDLAIRAVEQINAEHGIRCTLLITANPKDVAEGLAAQYPHEHAEVRVIGVVREIKDVYDSIDVFISPSRSEAFAYAVAETAYCQCQVIASDVPGQNTMKDIPGILWVESDNVQSLVDAILQSVERKNNGEAEKIKVGQRKYVREHYGVDLWVQKNLDVYKKYFS